MYLAALAAFALPLLVPTPKGRPTPRIGPTTSAPDVDGDLKKADRQFDRRNWAGAAEGYAKVTAVDPSQARAWFNLGYAWHRLGEFEKSCAAARRASEFPAYRPTALYNLACAHTLLGRVEEGGEALDAALAAGFLDYDTMAVDSDIAPLREAGRIVFAPQRDSTPFKFRNGVECAYEVILPEGYEPGQARRAVVCFPPGSGRQRSADWFVSEVLGGDAAQAGCIVVVLTAPEEGWISHPAHHALEGLLKRVRNEHAIEGKFHVMGYADGARPAATYARMARKYFETLSTVSSRAWASWDDAGKSFRDGMPVHVIAGEEDATAVAQARSVGRDIEEHGGSCRVTIVPENGRLLTDLRGAALLDLIAPAGAHR